MLRLPTPEMKANSNAIQPYIKATNQFYLTFRGHPNAKPVGMNQNAI